MARPEVSAASGDFAICTQPTMIAPSAMISGTSHQPMLTVGDALISISYGVTLFSEQLRVGWWLVPQIVALACIIVGCVQIAKSPLAAEASGLVTETASPVL